MQIQKVAPVRSINDKSYTQQHANQSKKSQTGGLEFAKILAEQFK